MPTYCTIYKGYLTYFNNYAAEILWKAEQEVRMKSFDIYAEEYDNRYL